MSVTVISIFNLDYVNGCISELSNTRPGAVCINLTPYAEKHSIVHFYKSYAAKRICVAWVAALAATVAGIYIYDISGWWLPVVYLAIGAVYLWNVLRYEGIDRTKYPELCSRAILENPRTHFVFFVCDSNQLTAIDQRCGQMRRKIQFIHIKSTRDVDNETYAKSASVIVVVNNIGCRIECVFGDPIPL